MSETRLLCLYHREEVLSNNSAPTTRTLMSGPSMSGLVISLHFTGHGHEFQLSTDTNLVLWSFSLTWTHNDIVGIPGPALGEAGVLLQEGV